MTDFARDILVRDGVPQSRVVVKPNHVSDPGTPSAWGSRRPCVLFSGRLVEEKGVRTLLRAWSQLGPSGHTLRICGDGPLMDVVLKAARQDPSIEPLGWLAEEDMREEQRGAVLTVVPSEWYEAGPPLVLLDSLAHGTPVLCSDLENISASVVSSAAGETFRTGDSASLAERLRTMLADQQALRNRGAAARALYEVAHTPAHSLRILEDTYDDVRRVGAP
jgi:glycosyltransferase involved in cell wall biosynthesis